MNVTSTGLDRLRNTHVYYLVIIAILIGVIIMATGHPDGGQEAQSNFGTVMSDPGELAARLGSPVTYYRSGKVLYYDGFEGVIETWLQAPIGGGSIDLVVANHYMGKQGVAFTSSSTSSSEQSIYKYFPYAGENTVGVELVWLAEGVNITYISLEFQVIRDEQYNVYAYRINPATGEVSIKDNLGVWNIEATINPILTNSYVPIIVKLVGDPANEVYKYIKINDDTIDLTGISSNVGIINRDDQIGVFIRAKQGQVAGNKVHIDNFILTVDEP